MRFAKNTQHDTSKVLRLPRKMTMGTSKVLRLPRKLQHIFWKRHKSIAPATQNDFQHVAKHVWMSRSATPATRNEATTRQKPPKITTSAELPIGTAIWFSRGRLRTVANGCVRERNVERTHPQPPDPQSEAGTLATHSGKTTFAKVRTSSEWKASSLGAWCFKSKCFNLWNLFFIRTTHPFWGNWRFNKSASMLRSCSLLKASCAGHSVPKLCAIKGIHVEAWCFHRKRLQCWDLLKGIHFGFFGAIPRGNAWHPAPYPMEPFPDKTDFIAKTPLIKQT